MASLSSYQQRLSGEPIIDSLVNLDWWRPNPWPADGVLDYAFMTTNMKAVLFGGSPSGDPIGVTAMNAIQTVATDQIMSYVGDLLNIPIAQAPMNSLSADIYFAAADLSGSTAGVTYMPYEYSTWNGTVTSFQTAAFIYMDISNVGTSATDTPMRGNFGYEILLHEIGHALGLGHPFEGPYALPPGTDDTSRTVMSYTDGPGGPFSEFREWDLRALRYLYPSADGAAFATTEGADILTLSAGNDILAAWGGNDIISAGGGADIVYGNLGADILYGNMGDDTLYGGQGADILYGGQDADVVYGNLGDDVLYGNMGADQLYGGQGADTLFGGQGNDSLYGNEGDDVLYGNLGDDQLFGGGGADVFILAVGSGRDTVLDFNAAEGDRIRVTDGAAWTLESEAIGTLVRVSDGGGLLLTGIAASQVSITWFQ